VRTGTLLIALCLARAKKITSGKVDIVTIDFNAIVAGVLLLPAAFASGFVLGGSCADTRTVLAFGTAQRDLSAALLVAVENFSDPRVVVMLIVMVILGVCIQIPIAVGFGRRSMRERPQE
jgi:hypothetical protein